MLDRMLRGLTLPFCLAALAAPVLAAPILAGPALADDEDGPKTPSMHQMAANPPVPRARKDFSQFRYRPAGDKVVEQSDANRLLFWTPEGTPDGYAERRGDAIFYYDRAGKVTRVDPADPATY
ncbi:hypothetical protein AAC691_04555 [Nguyenibacter vanlangensis]|uniref:Uncharacterized protein n=1 Tax=Nguyenibacter vanlangensis TaxID=1216886 RepID=A0A7Y7IY23_9PROT|nr:hypothetical protein [Nguyenibacter vanlangensis]NVN11971.1 hypothetical protein [Nguyenibacter vanlangensis]